MWYIEVIKVVLWKNGVPLFLDLDLNFVFIALAKRAIPLAATD
jgi:hypothetical protein